MFNFAQKTVDYLFGKGYLSGGYAMLLLAFVLLCVGFIAWAIYYAVAKNGIEELKKISWLSKGNTLKLTGIVVFSILISSVVLFGYDTVVDKIVNLIITNANKA